MEPTAGTCGPRGGTGHWAQKRTSSFECYRILEILVLFFLHEVLYCHFSWDPEDLDVSPGHSV